MSVWPRVRKRSAGSCFGASTSTAVGKFRGAVLVSPSVSFFAVPRAHHTVSQGGSAPLGQHKYMYLLPGLFVRSKL